MKRENDLMLFCSFIQRNIFCGETFLCQMIDFCLFRLQRVRALRPDEKRRPKILLVGTHLDQRAKVNTSLTCSSFS